MNGKSLKSGFTLVEMMVVMGLIAILSGLFLMTYTRIQQSAQRAKAQAQVSDIAVALVELHRKAGGWPEKILSAASGDHRMTKEVAKVFAEYDLLGISRGKDDEPTGVDRFGIVTPWAQTELRRRGVKATESTPVSTGKTVKDHLLYFAVDADEDGLVESGEGAPVTVRGTALVWSAGADGELGTYGVRSKTSVDDVYSWQHAQEKK